MDKHSTADNSAQQNKLFPAELCSAASAVPPEQKRKAYVMLAAAGVTLGALFLSRLFWLFKPLLDMIYYGTLSEVLYFLALAIMFTVYVVFLHRFVKRHCGYGVLSRGKSEVGTLCTLIIIAIGATTFFCISAGFGFKVKIEVEMGAGVTIATALTNIAVYVYYGLHLWLGLIAAALFQHAMGILVPTPRSIPWGAILLVTVFGLIELILELYTTTHVYPLLYYGLTYVYATVYELSKRSFHLTFWACVVIMVL